MMMQKERLNRLADKLEGVGAYKEVGPVPKHKFDMKYLYCVRQGGDYTNLAHFNPDECKTAACALGWAEVDPWFVKEGISDCSSAEFWGINFYMEERKKNSKKDFLKS